MKKKALPVGTMFLVLVIALAFLGVGYAFWSETLTISGTVETGEVDVEFSTYDPVRMCRYTNRTVISPEPAGKDQLLPNAQWTGARITTEAEATMVSINFWSLSRACIPATTAKSALM